jgi:hypothetical protein
MRQPQLLLAALVIAGVICLPAAAGDYKGPLPRRQIAHCMVKRMMADRSESYNAAIKACKEQIEPVQGDTHETAMNQVAGAETAKK